MPCQKDHVALYGPGWPEESKHHLCRSLIVETGTEAQTLCLCARGAEHGETECMSPGADMASEIERLRQGLWDVYAALGFDTDGDPTPRSLAYPDIVTLVLDAARDVRSEMENLP